MTIAFDIVIAALFFLVFALRIISGTHIFQLNSYKSKVQLHWIEKNRWKLLWQSIFLLLGLVVSFLIENVLVSQVCAIVAFAGTVPLNIPQKAKKPLVYTKRVIRLLITVAVLAIGIVALAFFLPSISGFKYAILFFLAFIAPLIILLANLINKPIELLINRWYIEDAKKLLRSHSKLITIGVTGSYGKTSVKFMLGTLLEAKYNVLVTPESYNTPLGITKTVRSSLKATHDVFVCEMGAKNVGDIKEICQIVHPTHGIITSIGPQHLESFHTLDNVKKTKFELADAISIDGKLFLNGEDSNIRSYKHPHHAITYGLTPECDYYAEDISVTSSGTSFVVRHGKDKEHFSMSLLGMHNVINLVGAIAVCCELGIELKKLPPLARTIQPVPHRLQLMKRDGITIIDDAFNANPIGVKRALEVLSMFQGYKVVVTPGMVELGKVQEEENYKFGEQMASVCDFAVLVGKKQTEPILKGLIEHGFPESKIFVTESLSDGAKKAFSREIGSSDKVVLFENDLPDNY